MRWLWLPLTIVGIAMLLYGVEIGRPDAVKRHAMTLCTACIGLTVE